jgi:hypothetical protein
VHFFIYALAFATGLAQLGTVAFLLAGPVRRYTFVLVYSLAQLITSLLEFVVVRRFGEISRQYRIMFWSDEIALDLLLFLILMLLTYRAMEGSPARRAMGRMLGAVTIAVMGLPFLLFQGTFVKMAWFDHTSQLLNSAILNLGLWTALLRSGRRDKTLLTVSAGFGIIATGGRFLRFAAAGQGTWRGIVRGEPGIRGGTVGWRDDPMLGIPAVERGIWATFDGAGL